MFHRRTLLAGLAALPLLPPGRASAAEDGLGILDLYRLPEGLTDLARSLDGEILNLPGYMAPPLQAQSNFFVLTGRPMAICPFCDSSEEWPEEIIAVYAKRVVEVAPFYKPIEVTGRLVLAEREDRETGFVSVMHLDSAVYRMA